MKPLVSVIIPAYNQANFIAEAIESVRMQDYPQDRIEIVVVDDGSTDGTADIVKGLGEDIEYHYQENAGKSSATAFGISVARGDLIFNLDPDDKFLQGKISSVVALFQKYPSVVHVGHPVVYWDPKKNTRRNESLPGCLVDREMPGMDLLRFFLRGNCFYGGGSSFSARASSLKDIGISKAIGFTVDAYMVYYLLSRGNSYYMDKPLSLYRLHGGAYSGKGIHERAGIDMAADEAILISMKAAGIPKDIEALFALKAEKARIRFLETEGMKKLADIRALWGAVFAASSGAGFWKLAASYQLVRHSLPGVVLGAVKGIKGAGK